MCKALRIAACLLLAAGAARGARAQELVKASGVRAGLVVHLGVTDGKLDAALGKAGNFLVHGLAADDAAAERARKHVEAQGLYGTVSVERSAFDRLPYAEDIVNLLVVSAATAPKVKAEEVARVLAPDGVACFEGGAPAGLTGPKALKSAGKWTLVVKPRPAGMDEFTHHNYDASCNRVGRDKLAEAPFSMRWMDGPSWTTSGSGPITMVSAGGRIFTGVQERYRFGNKKVSRVYATARDGYNGKVLWKKRAQGFSALTAIATRDVFYTVIESRGPLVALDAVSGEVVRTYKQAGAPEWAVFHDGKLIMNAGSKYAKKLKCVEAASGKILWTGKRSIRGSKLVPNVAVDAEKGELYFLHTVRKDTSPPTLGCIDLASGREKWSAKAGGFPTGKGNVRGLCAYQNGVIVVGAGNARGGGGAYAFSAKGGKPLWKQEYGLVCSGRPSRHKGSNYIDGYFLDGLFWTLAGNGFSAKGKDRRAVGWHGVDPKTGKVAKRVELKADEYIGDSCHRTNASVNYFLGGHARFVDRRTGRLAPRSYAVHNGCHFGMIPANGLFYTSSIYLNHFILGEMGLAGKRDLKRDAPNAPGRLEKGPGSAGGQAGTPGDWPCFRANPMGSGASAAKVPEKPTQLWAKKIGARLGPPTAVGDTVFVADLDGLKVLAVDASNGKVKWSRAVGGRVLVPPTCYRGTVLFGCGDGWVYCLNAGDGKLVWRYRAAPARDRIIVRERLESVWPVHTGVVVVDGLALFAAGRAGTLDGGVEVCAADAASGKLAWHKHSDTVSIVQLGVSDGKSYSLHYKARFAVKGGGPAGSIKGAGHNPDVLDALVRLGGKGAYARILPQIQLRAVARAGGTVFTAGPPALKAVKRRSRGGIVNYPEDNPDQKESELCAFSASGQKLHTVKLEALPVFDGMAAAGDKLFLSTQDGKLRCFGKR